MHIIDEFSPLKKVVVCYGEYAPEADGYQPTDPQELKWGWKDWDNELLLEQQRRFFERLAAYDVELIFPETDQQLEHQMYTRDTGFVIGDQLYYADARAFQVRQGEIEKLLAAIEVDQSHVQPINQRIEGGDVIVHQGGCLVGISDRTTQAAVEELAKHTEVRGLLVGDDVMHLDTRLTLLPNNYALVYLEAFTDEDRAFLHDAFEVIPVTKEEVDQLGTNVFVVNPETIFVEASQTRIQDELRQVGFKIEALPYTEPIALGGSFRCTTLPLEREG